MEEVVSREVADAYASYRGATEQVEISDQAVRSGTNMMSRYDDQLAGGLVRDADMPDYFEDLLLARRMLTEALVQYYQSAYNCNLALARIRLATANDEYRTFVESHMPDAPGVDHAARRTATQPR